MRERRSRQPRPPGGSPFADASLARQVSWGTPALRRLLPACHGPAKATQLITWLTADGPASTIAFTVGLPRHVNLPHITIMPTQQV